MWNKVRTAVEPSKAEAVRVRVDRGVEDRASGEPRALQSRQCVATRDQRAQSGRIAEEFVERERDKVRGRLAQAERV